MSVAEGFESMWSLHGRFPPEQASTQSTMRFFCDLKNMIVAIIKSTKVHLGLAWLLELWGESVHIFSFLFLLEWKENDLLMFLQAKCLFPAQVFGWTSLLVRDLWSSPPVVALACLHILPYLCILQDQRLLLFWIVPEAEHCFFFMFFHWTGMSGQLKLELFFLLSWRTVFGFHHDHKCISSWVMVSQNSVTILLSCSVLLHTSSLFTVDATVTMSDWFSLSC